MKKGGKTSPKPNPIAAKFTSSPLRNRIRIELKAPVPEVWALVGDLSRFPEYSSGLKKVDAKTDSKGRCLEYVCHFKPTGEGGEGIVHREIMRWYEPNRGYASSGEEGTTFEIFGEKNGLNLVTLERFKPGTILAWDQYFEARDPDMSKASYDAAFADIAEQLIRRFGGRVIERYVEGK